MLPVRTPPERMSMSESVKVLIVDDEPQNIAMVRQVLERPGIELLPCGSGADAIQMLLEHEVALALIDTDMPGMDGLQLAELMRASPHTLDVPVLFMARPGEDSQRIFGFREGGAVDFLPRPLEPHALRGKVEILIKLHSHQQRLTRQLKTMEQSLRLNEMFAAVLGHDLRSPLSAIMVGAELIIVRAKDEGDVSAAQRIRDSAKRMSHLIGQLIDMARVRSGHINLSLQATDFAKVCRDVAGEVESIHQQRLVIDITGDTQGVWDPHRLSQILSNLIGNAVKHGDPNQPVNIRIDGSQPGKLQCTVQNNGVITPQLLPHIFKPFRGYESGGDRRAGLGLGLYIVQQLVTMHGGEIGVQSSASTGTLFTLTMKRKTVMPTAATLANPSKVATP